MEEAAEVLLTIDLRLRFAFSGLESAMNITFAGAELERVFLDSDHDQVSAKQYMFFESPRLTVTGRVDEYEPDSIWLCVKGYGGCGEVLRRVAEESEFAVIKMQ